MVVRGALNEDPERSTAFESHDHEAADATSVFDHDAGHAVPGRQARGPTLVWGPASEPSGSKKST
jgi:hypothetical protein